MVMRMPINHIPTLAANPFDNVLKPAKSPIAHRHSQIGNPLAPGFTLTGGKAQC
jgi:hypothetical protein